MTAVQDTPKPPDRTPSGRGFLLSLGVACWPGAETAPGRSPALRAMVAYNLLATIYLVRLGLGGELVGRLLWPAVALHVVLAFLLARAWFRPPEPSR